jgi:hypothetical protein
MAINQISYYQNGLSAIEPTAYIPQDPFKSLPSPVRGLSFPTSQLIKLSARKVSYQISTLGQTTHVYTSTIYDDITALADYFADWSCNYEIVEGAIHTITVTAPWDTITSEDFYVSLFATEQWELVPTMDTKPLYAQGLLNNSFKYPNAAGNYVVLPVPLQLAVQKSIENKSIINITSGSYTVFNKQAQQIQQYIRMGVEGVPSYTQTLKRTAVVDKNNRNDAFNSIGDATYNQLNSQGTVNYLLSSNSLINTYGIPIDTVGKFMNKSYMKKSNPTIDVFPWTTYAGWLIKPPTFQFISRNKVQLTQEFIWNEYLDGIYYIESPIGDFPQVIVATNTPTT